MGQFGWTIRWMRLNWALSWVRQGHSVEDLERPLKSCQLYCWWSTKVLKQVSATWLGVGFSPFFKMRLEGIGNNLWLYCDGSSPISVVNHWWMTQSRVLKQSHSVLSLGLPGLTHHGWIPLDLAEYHGCSRTPWCQSNKNIFWCLVGEKWMWILTFHNHQLRVIYGVIKLSYIYICRGSIYYIYIYLHMHYVWVFWTFSAVSTDDLIAEMDS